MIADRHAFDQSRNLQPAPAWAEVWHLWTVIIPRRSITGKLVYGRVWRRCDGRHWIYKKFVEYDGAKPFIQPKASGLQGPDRAAEQRINALG
jgi:hypothetical protein